MSAAMTHEESARLKARLFDHPRCAYGDCPAEATTTTADPEGTEMHVCDEHRQKLESLVSNAEWERLKADADDDSREEMHDVDDPYCWPEGSR